MDFSGRYTENEAKLIAILQELGGKPADSKRITFLHYKKRQRPENAQRSVVVTLRSLEMKVRKSREKFLIKRTVRCGPHPVSYWIEPKQHAR